MVFSTSAIITVPINTSASSTSVSPSPTSTVTSFILSPITNTSTCVPLDITWTVGNPTPTINDTVALNIFAVNSLGQTDPNSKVIVTNAVDILEQKFQWSAVVVPPGQYLVQAIICYTDVVINSSTFFVTVGTNTTCIPNATAGPPATPLPSIPSGSTTTTSPSQTLVSSTTSPSSVPANTHSATIFSSVAGAGVVLICLILAFWFYFNRRSRRKSIARLPATRFPKDGIKSDLGGPVRDRSLWNAKHEVHVFAKDPVNFGDLYSQKPAGRNPPLTPPPAPVMTNCRGSPASSGGYSWLRRYSSPRPTTAQLGRATYGTPSPLPSTHEDHALTSPQSEMQTQRVNSESPLRVSSIAGVYGDGDSPMRYDFQRRNGDERM